MEDNEYQEIIISEKELQKKFKDKIIETINYIKDFSEYDVLSYFYWEYKICYGEEKQENNIVFKSLKVMYLQVLFSCCKNNTNTKKLNEKILKK